jgi:hypothetical protein
METVTFNIGEDTIILVSEILKQNNLPSDGESTGRQIVTAIQNLQNDEE